MNDLSVIAPLSQEKRIEAAQRAQSAIAQLAGQRPTREQFRHSGQSEYPGWLQAVVVGLALVVLVCSFVISAMRLYHIGYSTFRDSIDHSLSAMVAGAAIVLLSEAAAVLFTIALSVIGKTKEARRILQGSVAATAALALSGNFYVALYGHSLTAFTILEAMLPPLLTLSTAYVLKLLLLEALAARVQDQRAYEAALSEWRIATENAAHHPRYVQVYANELRDELRKANNRKRAAADLLPNLSSAEWSALVRRELAADEWYSDDSPSLSLPEPGRAESDTQPSPAVDEDFLAPVGAGKNAASSRAG